MEYNNNGAGADTKARVAWSKQLTKKEAQKITIESVLGDFIKHRDTETQR